MLKITPMRPPPDYLNLLYALENNIQEIHFSASLDPVITPIKSVRIFVHNITSYMDFFEAADPAQSVEPLVVEYYKLKHRLKPFEDVVAELEGSREPEPEFFPLQINEFVSNGTMGDLYVAPFRVAEELEDDMEEDALRFFEEARKIAMRWCNQKGVELSGERIQRLREKMDADAENQGVPEEDVRC